MLKKRSMEIKGFIIGIIFITVLSGTVVMANPVIREIVFGVGVNFNGNMITFDEDSRPFIMDGRTYLPVRSIAELTGLNVDFADGIVYLTNDFSHIVPMPMPTAEPIQDTSIVTVTGNNTVEFEREVFCLVNEERAKAGLPGLEWNDSLALAARNHSLGATHTA